MKTKILIMSLGLCILMIVLSGIQMNHAFSKGPTICYDGQKKEFVYFNIKDKDLFTDLKDLMPGDKKEQEVTFKAQNIRTNTKFFINISKSSDENIEKYIKIYANNKELIKNEEYIELANFSNDDELTLKVIVNVPKEAGNELQDLEYNLEWNILVQEENGEIIDVPNTYDSTNISLYIAIIIISFIIMIYTIRKIYENK